MDTSFVPSVIDPKTGKQFVPKGPALKRPIGKPIAASDKIKRPKIKPPILDNFPHSRSSGGITGPGGKQVNSVYNTY